MTSQKLSDAVLSAAPEEFGCEWTLRDETKDPAPDSSASSKDESPAHRALCSVSRVISVPVELTSLLLTSFTFGI